jgi:hypothetical protein
MNRVGREYRGASFLAQIMPTRTPRSADIDAEGQSLEQIADPLSVGRRMEPMSISTSSSGTCRARCTEARWVEEQRRDYRQKR